MLPNTIESWVYLLIACFIGFVIGQWIKTRRDKAQTKNESAAKGLIGRLSADSSQQAKKVKKKKARKKI